MGIKKDVLPSFSAFHSFVSFACQYLLDVDQILRRGSLWVRQHIQYGEIAWVIHLNIDRLSSIKLAPVVLTAYMNE